MNNHCYKCQNICRELCSLVSAVSFSPWFSVPPPYLAPETGASSWRGLHFLDQWDCLLEKNCMVLSLVGGMTSFLCFPPQFSTRQDKTRSLFRSIFLSITGKSTGRIVQGWVQTSGCTGLEGKEKRCCAGTTAEPAAGGSSCGFEGPWWVPFT